MLKILLLFFFFFSQILLWGVKVGSILFNNRSFVKKLALLRVRCIVLQTCEYKSGTEICHTDIWGYICMFTQHYSSAGHAAGCSVSGELLYNICLVSSLCVYV